MCKSSFLLPQFFIFQSKSNPWLKLDCAHQKKTHWKRVIHVIDVLVVMCAQSYPCWNTRLNSKSFVYFLNTTFTSSDRWTGPVKSSLPVWVLWLHSIQWLDRHLVHEGFIGLIDISIRQSVWVGCVSCVCEVKMCWWGLWWVYRQLLLNMRSEYAKVWQNRWELSQAIIRLPLAISLYLYLSQTCSLFWKTWGEDSRKCATPSIIVNRSQKQNMYCLPFVLGFG